MRWISPFYCIYQSAIKIGWNYNGLKSEWIGIEIENINQNKLFTLTAIIRIRVTCINIDVLTLFWNRNGLLQITKIISVDYCHYLL